MNIAYVSAALGIPVQGPSGASAHIRDCVTALRDAHEVDLFSPLLSDRRGRFGPSVHAIETGVVGWPSWLKNWRAYREVRVSRRLTKAVLETKKQWDVVVERHSLFSDSGRKISQKRSIPWLLEVNAPLVDERLKYESLSNLGLAKKWEKDILQSAPSIIAVSQWIKDWLESTYNCSNVRHIPNGVNLIDGCPTRGREILGLTNDRPIVGFVGSMKPWHGLSFVKQLIPHLDAQFVFIGHNAPIIEGCISMPVYDPIDLADVVSSFSVGLAPYMSDAPPWFSPLKILQYRAQGVPVVAPDIGDCRLLMADCGQEARASDLDAWVHAIQSEMGARYPKTVRSWGVVASEILSDVDQSRTDALH